MTDENQNPYRQAREVENDALSRMTEPSPKEIGWDEGYAAGLHEAEAALEVAAQIMRDIPDAAITEGGWHNRAFGWLAAHDRRLAAATPDPPTDAHRPWPIAPDTVMPSRRQPVRWGSRADDPPTEIHDDPEKTKAYLAGLAAGRTEAPAASPDERLREAVAALPQYVITIQDREGYTYERGCAGQPMNYTGVMLADVEALIGELKDGAPAAREATDELKDALRAIASFDAAGDARFDYLDVIRVKEIARLALAAADRGTACTDRENAGVGGAVTRGIVPSGTDDPAAADREKPEER